ncbi:MAG: SDR family NAD(P)-dependent oxidoreductase [Nitrosopumilaceae archaeon]
MKIKKLAKSKSKILKELKNKTVLITGGAGSIGTALTREILEYPVRAVRVLDIDEHALFRLNRSINDDRLRLLLGSILDKDRIEMAANKADIIFHVAAVKNIEITEFNPIETIDTNINGIVNMIKMTMKDKPKKFLNISTDKAVLATTLYGATKQLGEKLTSWAGKHIVTTKFASIRLGNVIETRGNVFEIWNEESKNARPLSITDLSMKRYFFHIDEAIDFILQCLPLVNQGEIFVPKMKLRKIRDLASKISKKHQIIGLRPGEKIEELLIASSEKKKAEELKNMWVIKQYS